MDRIHNISIQPILIIDNDNSFINDSNLSNDDKVVFIKMLGLSNNNVDLETLYNKIDSEILDKALENLINNGYVEKNNCNLKLFQIKDKE